MPWLVTNVNILRSELLLVCMCCTVEQYFVGMDICVCVVRIFGVTGVHLTHNWSPKKSHQTVYLQVAVVFAENLMYNSIWCKSRVPWSFSNSCLQKREFTWCLVWIRTQTHTPASCLIVTLKLSSSLRRDLQTRSALKHSPKRPFYGICNCNLPKLLGKNTCLCLFFFFVMWSIYSVLLIVLCM